MKVLGQVPSACLHVAHSFERSMGPVKLNDVKNVLTLLSSAAAQTWPKYSELGATGNI